MFHDYNLAIDVLQQKKIKNRCLLYIVWTLKYLYRILANALEKIPEMSFGLSQQSQHSGSEGSSKSPHFFFFFSGNLAQL